MAFEPLHLPALLREHGLRPKKRLGQNFLVDEQALRRIVLAAEVGPQDSVLEIGPGAGSLTRHLAQAAGRVVAVELDGDLIPLLRQVLAPYDNVEIVHGNILEMRPPFAHAGFKVVANIPYYITASILRHLLESEPRPGLAALTVQQEVAQRICAGPGEMSLLAASVQFYGEPEIVDRIPAGAFYPRPEVDSAVVRIRLRDHPAVDTPDARRFFRIVQAGFSQKRKQLKNSLAAGLRLPASEVQAALQAAGVEPRRRAETLALDEWARVEVELGRTGQPLET